MKYVILKDHPPILFENNESMEKMIYTISDVAYGEPPIAAGYCVIHAVAAIDGHCTVAVKCWGSEVIKGIPSRGDVDAQLIDKVLNG